MHAPSPGATTDALLVDEVRWTIDVLELLTDDARARLAGDSTLALGPAGSTRRSFAAPARPRSPIDTARCWLARNRPGGLVDSVAWLDNLRAAYETGGPDPTWGGWPKRFT